MQSVYYLRIKIAIFLLPVFLFFIFLIMKLALPYTYMQLIQEDSAIEYMQALLYFFSSIISLLVSKSFIKYKHYLHGVLYCILAALMLFVSIEEISWMQRILDITNPGYFEQHNVQHEISLHNLDTVQPLLVRAYILVGAYGAFASLFISRVKIRSDHILNFVIPDWFISSYFFFVFFIYIIIGYIAQFCVAIGIEEMRIGNFLVSRDQEPAELFLSMGFFFFVVVNYIKAQKCLTNKPCRVGCASH